MKGNEKIIAKLDALLADELTATNQYILHSELCANWGYGRLHDAIERRAITEMKHAERLISRIIYLEGQPTVSKLNPVHIGASVEAQFKHDLQAEVEAVQGYNEGVALATKFGDNGSRELFESILKDEEDHVDWIESQLDQVSQMGIQTYLGQQIKE
jgi:bacterioferritin